MQNADDILAIYRERGSRGLPLERVYRQLFNPEWYLRAYGKIYRNAGATTKGSTEDTVDGMSLGRIRDLIEHLRHERFRWTPARREHIPKPKGGTRPLGIPTWTDKLLQEVMRTLLEAYYEPRFRESSHGFRPQRGCHTALYRVQTWTATVWFIEGDISKCFDRIDHSTLLGILREDILDGRFLNLVAGLLQAGYLEDWTYHETLAGTPQGGVVSPLLANIYLDRLDRFVEDELVPAYTRGRRKRWNPEYQRLKRQLRAAREARDWDKAGELIQLRRRIPSVDAYDPGFRRLRYVRYADDFLLGLIGTKQEATEIRDRIGAFLRDNLKLDLSMAKTLITHGGEKARFLGHEITVTRANTRLGPGGRRRAVNGIVALLMPADVVAEVRRRYSRGGKVKQRGELMHDNDYTIVSRYQSVLRGLYNFYALALNVSKRMSRIHWILQTSLLKTMARKYRTSVRREYARLRTWTQDGRRVLRVALERRGKDPLIAEFGGLAFERQRKPFIRFDMTFDELWRRYSDRRSELVARLLAGLCEICGSSEGIQVHHIRKMADLTKPGQRPPEGWKELMASRRRKTLVVCRKCHTAIHSGNYDGISLRQLSLESRVQ